MAEVPEVEKIARDLQATIVGRAITASQVFEPEVIRFATPAEFAHDITGAHIQAVHRAPSGW